MNLKEVIRELRELNEPVPKPLQLPSETEVSQAEAQLGIAFHPDYREYLLKGSDIVYGDKEPCTVPPNGGPTNLCEVALTAWTNVGMPRTLLPICEDNGDYYCMNEAGEVVFWSHNGISDEKWTDLATWIKQVWIQGE